MSRAEDALMRFDQAVAWSDLADDLRGRREKDAENAGTDESEHLELDEGEQEVVPEELAEPIELYRRGEKIEMSMEGWRITLAVFQEEGWFPTHAIETYLRLPGIVTQDEGKAMQKAGRSLFTKVDAEPAISVCLPMDLGLLYSVTEFVGEGAFCIGRRGASAALESDDLGAAEEPAGSGGLPSYTLTDIEHLLTIGIFKRLLNKYQPFFGDQAKFLGANILNYALLRSPEGLDAVRYVAENSNLIEQQATMICQDDLLSHAFGTLYAVMLIRIGPTDPERSHALAERASELLISIRTPEELCRTDDYFELLRNLKEYVDLLWGKTDHLMS
jgi:hypothetical protein